jgi:hypothetical protein
MVVQGIQVQLERLGLHQVFTVSGYGESADVDARNAGAVEPAELVTLPDVLAESVKSTAGELAPRIPPRDRKQQGRVVTGAAGHHLTE